MKLCFIREIASYYAKCFVAANTLEITFPFLSWNPSCEATPFEPEKWPFKRGGLSPGVEINTFMFRFTLSSGLSRGGGLLSGWPLKGIPLYVLLN